MKLYLDMDGVIADFFGAYEKKFNVSHWKEVEDPLLAIMSLKNTSWFDTLDVFPTTFKLVKAVREIAGRDYGICSSPITGDENNSAYWKRVWLTRHGLLPEIPNLIFTKEKWKFANERVSGEPNILVDDKYDNIKQWEAAGGIGIRYQANESDVGELISDLKYAYS
jgi:hypothetical protein